MSALEKQQTGAQEVPKPDPHEKMMHEFDAKRDTLSGNMRAVATSFKNTGDLLRAENLLYHVRQDLVDYRRELSIALGALNKKLKKLKYTRMMQHKGNQLPVLPANPTEKKIMDDDHFASVMEVIDRFDSQFEWCKGSISGCDEMSNGLSYYIKLANLLGGNTT